MKFNIRGPSDKRVRAGGADFIKCLGARRTRPKRVACAHAHATKKRSGLNTTMSFCCFKFHIHKTHRRVACAHAHAKKKKKLPKYTDVILLFHVSIFIINENRTLRIMGEANWCITCSNVVMTESSY